MIYGIKILVGSYIHSKIVLIVDDRPVGKNRRGNVLVNLLENIHRVFMGDFGFAVERFFHRVKSFTDIIGFSFKQTK